MSRPTWDQYALALADAARLRSEDPYVQVGAVVLRPDRSVAGVGYNGAPSKVVLNWASRDDRRPYVIHAEVNALRYCTPAEVAGGLVAVTGVPCRSCLTSIAAHGIHDVIYADELENYQTEDSVAAGWVLGVGLTRVRRWQPVT